MSILYQYLHSDEPDIIAFQEVSYYRGMLQVANILDSLQYEFVYNTAHIWKGREEGLIIASKYPIIQKKVIVLPKAPNDENRIALFVQCKVGEPNSMVTMINTHLTYVINNTEARLQQLRAVLQHASEIVDKQESVILCGDFNEDYKYGGVYDEIINNSRTKFRDTWENQYDKGITFSSYNPYVVAELWPDRRLDYIFYSKGLFSTQSSHLVMNSIVNKTICSDHYGILAYIEKESKQ